jgi:hypothetical protein
VAVAQERRRDVATDETRTAGDNDVQACSS